MVPVILQSLTGWQYKLLLYGLNWEPLFWTLGPSEQSVKRFPFNMYVWCPYFSLSFSRITFYLLGELNV